MIFSIFCIVDTSCPTRRRLSGAIHPVHCCAGYLVTSGSVLSDSIPWVIAISPWYPQDAAAQFAEQPQLLHACEESHGEHIGTWGTVRQKWNEGHTKFGSVRNPKGLTSNNGGQETCEQQCPESEIEYILTHKHLPSLQNKEWVLPTPLSK